MKVALVCPYDWARHGGVKAHVSHLARYLYENHDVRILAPSSIRPTRTTAPPLVEIVGHPVPIPYNRSVAAVALSPVAVRRTLRFLADFAPHVVHVHEPFVPTVSLAAAAFGPRPVVATFHAWSESDRLYRATAPLARRISRRMAACIAVSPAAQAYAAEALRLPMGAFRVLPNGVDTHRYARAEPLPQLLDPERPLLLFVGRLEERKGLDVLIRAFLRLRASWPNVRLCVVGEGPERDRCQQMVPTSVRPDVLFVGSVDERDKPRYHASADIYVAPNVGGESFGIVLLEAMAAGLPIVAADIPGFRTVMKDGRQGRLVPPNESFALADAIATLLSNDKLRKAMADEGRRTADDYAWSVVGARIEAVYRAALRGD